MSVPLAYSAVVLVWSTTPLGVKWSAEGLSPFAGAFLRIAIAAMLAWVVCQCVGLKIRWDRKAMQVYLAANVGWFVGLLSVYQASISLSSGLISVLFGLSPIVSGVMARPLLGEPPFSGLQWVSLICGVTGLGFVFGGDLPAEGFSVEGILFALFGVVCFCLSGVLIKRIEAGLNPFSQTTGALLVSVPCYGVAMLLTGQSAIDMSQVSQRAILAVLYLAVFGSVIGFLSYFYVLEKLSASTVAAATLITPVLALLLGAVLEDEQVTVSLLAGAACILVGLVLFLFESKLFSRRSLSPD